jgi:hypothetical protein
MSSEETDDIVQHPWVGTKQPQVPAEQQPSNPIRVAASRSAAVFTR